MASTQTNCDDKSMMNNLTLCKYSNIWDLKKYQSVLL